MLKPGTNAIMVKKATFGGNTEVKHELSIFVQEYGTLGQHE